jgi:hypothetical protein
MAGAQDAEISNGPTINEVMPLYNNVAQLRHFRGTSASNGRDRAREPCRSLVPAQPLVRIT